MAKEAAVVQRTQQMNLKEKLLKSRKVKEEDKTNLNTKVGQTVKLAEDAEIKADQLNQKLEEALKALNSTMGDLSESKQKQNLEKASVKISSLQEIANEAKMASEEAMKAAGAKAAVEATNTSTIQTKTADAEEIN